MGIDCDIIAVTSIPRSTEDKRLKDDRRDAQSLLEAVTAPSSKCKAVHIPSEESEAARDLCRAYYDMVLATKRLKMQISAMLLRHGFVWNERTPKGNLRLTWTKEYIKWARSVRLPADAENQTLKFYLKGVLDGLDRCNEIRRKCLELSENERSEPYVDALTRLKGVDRMGAPAFVATVDDFSRFRNGRSVSKRFGLTPTRHDSGEKTGRNGRISKAGDTTVRKAVVEGLASLPNHDKAQKHMSKGCEAGAAVEAEAGLCNSRNVDRYRSLVKRGKRPNVAKVAVASELVRQMWAIGNIVRGELAQA